LPRPGKSRRTGETPKRRQRPPLVCRKARVSHKQVGKLIDSYAGRLPPQAAARSAGVSLNTAHRFYNFIRARLLATGYYENTALSKDDEAGLAPEVIEQLRQRRGIRPEDVPLHAAELIDWAEGWPPRLVAQHIRAVLALTGPLDDPADLSEAAYERVQAYVRYARMALLYDRLRSRPDPDAARIDQTARVKARLDELWRAYRAASKRVERQGRETVRLA